VKVLNTSTGASGGWPVKALIYTLDFTRPFSDELKSYDGLESDYQHAVINHAVEYVNGNVHTNTMENFWSLLKRGLHGTYISVEPFHLFRYIDEQAFRYKTRGRI